MLNNIEEFLKKQIAYEIYLDCTIYIPYGKAHFFNIHKLETHIILYQNHNEIMSFPHHHPPRFDLIFMKISKYKVQ